MQIWQAFILGIVQGVTEFLPISSSGHLLLFEQILNVNTENSELFLGIMLHAGTLVAVCFVYYKKLVALLFKNKRGLIFLIIATIPAAVVGYFLSDYIDKLIQGRIALAIAFFTSGILLIIAEVVQKRRKEFTNIVGIKSSILMGIGQALAVLPGISRSGSTYAAGICSGLDKQAALDFSFMMSIPIILGAIFNEILKICTGATSIAMHLPLTNLLIGMTSATIFGILSIKLYKTMVLAGKFKYFAIYLVILAGVLFFFPIV